MDLLDNLEVKAAEIAKSTGLALADVHAIADMVQSISQAGWHSEMAIEAAAAQHGVDTATVREIVARAGGYEGEIADVGEHSVKHGGT